MVSAIEQRILAAVKPKKVTPYNTWKEAVLESYPTVFFPNLSAKRKAILQAVTDSVEESNANLLQFFQWVVTNWPTLAKRAGIKAFDTYPYPELELVLFNYAKLLNLYNSQPTFVNTNQKKKVDLSFLNNK